MHTSVLDLRSIVPERNPRGTAGEESLTGPLVDLGSKSF